jgi:hypothetical protein
LKPESNFRILLRDETGAVVPDSVRVGHNVVTSVGHDIFAQLIAWSYIGVIDTAFTQRRARYIGVGNGVQVEDRGVVALVGPLEVTSAVYLKELDPSLFVFTSATAVLVKALFSPSEITYATPAETISEAGLYFDVSPGGVLDVSLTTNAPSCYKTFSPLVKLNSFSMEVAWELKF